MFRSLRISHVEFWFPGSEKLGPSRNGRMERNFPVIPILRNFRPTSRGTTQISEWNYGKCLFHSLPNPEFLEFLVEWKAPTVMHVNMIRKFRCVFQFEMIRRPILFVLSILMLVFYFSYISVSPGLKFPLLVRGEWYIKRDILLFWKKIICFRQKLILFYSPLLWPPAWATRIRQNKNRW